MNRYLFHTQKKRFYVGQSFRYFIPFGSIIYTIDRPSDKHLNRWHLKPINPKLKEIEETEENLRQAYEQI